MTNILKPIVFFGTEDFSLIALQTLIEAGYSIAAVITKPDSPQGRGHHLTSPAVKIFARERNIPVWQPNKLSDIAYDVTNLGNPVGILVSYGKIIPGSIIDLFTPGIINVHPSLLPLYRGPSPIESAILNGDKETGVSIMKLSPKMDAGPVYKQFKISLTGKEASKQLYENLGKTGSELLVEILPSIIDGSLLPIDQDESAATYCHMLKKSDGVIDWSKDAKIIEAQIRAYHIWPKSRTVLDGMEVIITSAEVIDADYGNPGRTTIKDGELIVSAGAGALRILSLKPLGKKEMPVRAFLSGYHSQPRS